LDAVFNGLLNGNIMANKELESLVAELLFISKDISNAEEQIYDDLLNVIEKCTKAGYIFDLEVDESVEWKQDGDYEVATATMRYKLKLGDQIIHEWFTDYVGDYEEIEDLEGLHWWPYESRTDFNFEIYPIIEMLSYEIDTPEVVPKPRRIEKAIS
jgi:hypothetical protein